jgi:hypothetical protein
MHEIGRRSNDPLKRLALLLALASALGAARPGAAQLTPAPSDPTAEAQARSRLLRTEAELALRLRQTGGDPRIGAELGQSLDAERDWQLDHPSPAVVRAIAAARDPAALALAIAGDRTGMYWTDVLLAALAARPRPTRLWLAAARTSFDPAYRAAFLDRALASMAPKGLGTPPEPAALAGAATIAAERLAVLLRAGLAREALADLDRLPAVLRERILAGEVRAAEVDGATVQPPPEDLRLELALAHFITGDEHGARALLSRAPGPVWRDDRPSMDDSIPGRAERTLAVRWLAAPGAADDSFPRLAGLAEGFLLAGSGVDLIALARLAERDGYPVIAAFAWRRAGTYLAQEDPDLAPPDLARAAARLRAAIAAQARAADAAAATDRAAAGEPPGALHLVLQGRRTCGPFTIPAASLELFALDRAGRRGIVISGEGCVVSVYPIEEHGGTWITVNPNMLPAGYSFGLDPDCPCCRS